MTVSEKENALRRLATQALQVQDACNLTAVANGFGRVMTELTRMGMATREANSHPIAKLWADKIASLTETQSFCPALLEAYNSVKAMSGEA